VRGRGPTCLRSHDEPAVPKLRKKDAYPFRIWRGIPQSKIIKTTSKEVPKEEMSSRGSKRKQGNFSDEPGMDLRTIGKRLKKAWFLENRQNGGRLTNPLNSSSTAGDQQGKLWTGPKLQWILGRGGGFKKKRKKVDWAVQPLRVAGGNQKQPTQARGNRRSKVRANQSHSKNISNSSGKRRTG